MGDAGAPGNETGAAARDTLLDWLAAAGDSSRVLLSLAIIVLAWLVMKLTGRALRRSAGRFARLRHLDEYRTKALVGRTRPVQFAVGIVVAVAVLVSLLALWQLHNVIAGVLAGAGVLGIVIGLAAGDTIGDIIAGFLIFFSHPFEIGDWVRIADVEGFVEDVGMSATTVLTFDNEKVTIPNRMVEGGIVRNYSHAGRVRRRLALGVEYGTDLESATKTLVEVALKHPDVLREPPPLAMCVAFSPSSVDMELMYWIQPRGRQANRIQSELVESVHRTFAERGIRIAFPHMRVVLPGPAGSPGDGAA